MLHISKSKKGKFYVAIISKNGLQVSCSQPAGLLSYKGAIRNIRAQLKVFGVESVRVQDNTKKKPTLIRVYANTIGTVVGKISKPFVPGGYPGRK